MPVFLLLFGIVQVNMARIKQSFSQDFFVQKLILLEDTWATYKIL